jgi:hypothetical protein
MFNVPDTPEIVGFLRFVLICAIPKQQSEQYFV